MSSLLIGSHPVVAYEPILLWTCVQGPCCYCVIEMSRAKLLSIHLSCSQFSYSTGERTYFGCDLLSARLCEASA